MSVCRGCGIKSEHVRLVLPWLASEPVVLVHRCNTRGCPDWGAWHEPVRDLAGALNAVLACRGTAGVVLIDADVAGAQGAAPLASGGKPRDAKPCPVCGLAPCDGCDECHAARRSLGRGA